MLKSFPWFKYLTSIINSYLDGKHSAHNTYSDSVASLGVCSELPQPWATKCWLVRYSYPTSISLKGLLVFWQQLHQLCQFLSKPRHEGVASLQHPQQHQQLRLLVNSLEWPTSKWEHFQLKGSLQDSGCLQFSQGEWTLHRPFHAYLSWN